MLTARCHLSHNQAHKQHAADVVAVLLLQVVEDRGKPAVADRGDVIDDTQSSQKVRHITWPNKSTGTGGCTPHCILRQPYLHPIHCYGCTAVLRRT